MKLAFSTTICPTWDLAAVIDGARRHRYAGVELLVSAEAAASPAGRGWSADPEGARRQLQAGEVELVCVATPAALDERDSESVECGLAGVGKSIELAAKMGCPFVRVYASKSHGLEGGTLCCERRETRLMRVSNAVRALVGDAVRHRVGVLIENRGEFADSASLWTIVEAAGSPLVGCCWSPSAGQQVLDQVTTAIPRLGSKLRLVRVCPFEPPGAGGGAAGTVPSASDTETTRMVQLLKGINYQGYLVVDQMSESERRCPGPRSAPSSVPHDADATLSATSGYLQKLLDEKPIVLSAYKGDKFRPRQGGEFTVQ
jgi:sugar phosphate isomerase/epimerase